MCACKENYLCLPQHLIFWTTEPQIHRGYAGLVLICLVGITVASSLPQAAWIRLQSQCLCFVHRTAVYSIYISFIRSANRSYSIQALTFVHAMANTLNNLLRVLITILINFSQPTCGQLQFLSLQNIFHVAGLRADSQTFGSRTSTASIDRKPLCCSFNVDSK
jgi:hypothetical protein